MNIEILAHVVAIAGAMALAFNYAVLRPLNSAIMRLDATVEKFDAKIERLSEKEHELDLRVNEVDNRARAAHARIDDIVGRGKP